MNDKRIDTTLFLPKKFWVRIHRLLKCEERSSIDEKDLKHNPEIRKTLVDLVFFPEVLN
jgi:hypothetical protein